MTSDRPTAPAPAATATPAGVEVSVVIPCLNEVESVAECVRRALAGIARSGREGEVVVVDNGSEDGSGPAAREAGARVIEEAERGYGSAYRAGFAAARGRYVVMADADLTYDFEDIPRFLEQLDDGADLVVGDRLNREMEPGAMPWLHRRIGNPGLTAMLNLFFRTGLTDTHCGMRAFRREHLERLAFRTTGMEFASEHIIRSAKLGLDIRELPITYRRRAGESKLSSFADGWRHLRLLLAHSPKWAFVLPGSALVAVGAALAAVVYLDVELFGRTWQFHALAAAALAVIGGWQILHVGLFARVFAARYLDEPDPGAARVKVEHGLVLGSALAFAGLVVCGVVVGDWIGSGLGPLHHEVLSLTGLTLIVLGLQSFFGALFMSVLVLGGRDPRPGAVRSASPLGRASLPVAPEETH